MAATSLVGRAEELAALAALVRAATEGRFGVLLLEGDAGTGKTSTVRAALDGAPEGTVVLAGACLPLTAVSVPLLGLRSAVRALPPEQRPPGLGGSPVDAAPPDPTPLAVDDWLTTLARNQPVVLVVDDLHWADAETLDVLMYVLAGPAARRLAVVLTVRSGDLGPHHPLRSWLADARRLHSVDVLPVGALGRDQVADLVEQTLGSAAHGSLVDDVLTRSRGNPYFARLLVTGLDPSTRHLPDHLPQDLAAATLGRWASLSGAAQRLLVAVAVGGRPVREDALALVAEVAGLAEPSTALRETVEAGLLEVAPDGAVWFRHPLQAEALEQGLLPEERRRLHDGFGRGLAAEARRAEQPAPELLAAVSDHLALAGRDAHARAWALEAAAAMADTDPRGRLRMLRRAADLTGPGAEHREERVGLLRAVQRLADELADWEADLAAVDDLLALLDGPEAGQSTAVEAAVLRAHRTTLCFDLGLGVTSVELEPAVRATERVRGSAERRYVLACYADLLQWESRQEEAHIVLDEALDGEAPSASRDEASTRFALAAWSRALACGALRSLDEGEGAAAAVLAEQAAALAVRARDPHALVHASYAELNVSGRPLGRDAADRCALRRRQLEDGGHPRRYIGSWSAAEAEVWLLLGEPERCRKRLRVALGSDQGPVGAVNGRLTAAMLAGAQGRQAEAEAHLARAEELVARPGLYTAFPLERVRATLALAGGDPERAVVAAVAGVARGDVALTGSEWLLPLAARGLADLAQARRDVGADPGPVLRRLADMRAEHPHPVPDGPVTGPGYQRVLDAFDRLYAAETARARDDGVVEAWRTAVGAFADLLPWEEVYVLRRAAEALLRRGESDARHEAAVLLRRGHALAARLGAAPEREALEALARSARVALSSVVAEEEVAPALAAAGLTRREREVLAHVVAGRTYAEIAGALFLSEKTVSSHISNILRKTGAANRVELAGWAIRAAPQ